jgi:WXG100 family type VII secretion target
MARIEVDFGALEGLIGELRDRYAGISACHDRVSGCVQPLAQVWSGAAADGHAGAQTSWQADAALVRDQLAAAHNHVVRAYENQAQAVRSNAAIWGG